MHARHKKRTENGARQTDSAMDTTTTTKTTTGSSSRPANASVCSSSSTSSSGREEDLSDWVLDSDNEELTGFVPLLSVSPHTTAYGTVEEAVKVDREAHGFDLLEYVAQAGLGGCLNARRTTNLSVSESHAHSRYSPCALSLVIQVFTTLYSS